MVVIRKNRCCDWWDRTSFQTLKHIVPVNILRIDMWHCKKKRERRKTRTNERNHTTFAYNLINVKLKLYETHGKMTEDDLKRGRWER